jgi:hypothetical protein
MIEQTIPLPELCAGMARCVREWILPHLTDPMARTQAQILASLLERLPASLGQRAAEGIAGDTEAARALLAKLGEQVAPRAAGAHRTIDDLMRENAALKSRLEELARAARQRARGGDADAKAVLVELQRFFEQSLAGEIALGAGEGTDFKSMTEGEDVARRQ